MIKRSQWSRKNLNSLDPDQWNQKKSLAMAAEKIEPRMGRTPEK